MCGRGATKALLLLCFVLGLQIWPLSAQSEVVFDNESALIIDIGSPVPRVDVSPDGTHILSSSFENGVQLWNLITGELMTTLPNPERTIFDIAFSADGALIAGGNEGGIVSVWDINSGEMLQSLDEHQGDVYGVAFAPDGATLASGSLDETVIVWELETGRPLLQIDDHSGYVGIIAFSPDGMLLATSSGDNTARIFEASTGESVHMLRGHRSFLWDVSFSADGETLVTAGGIDRTARLWSVETGEMIAQIETEGEVRSAVFSPDDTLIALSSSDEIRIFDAVSYELIQTLAGHDAQVNGLAFSPDGSVLVSGSEDGTVRVWDARS